MKSDTCLFLIHGFGGGFFEIDTLYNLLKKQGFNVHYIVLAGHDDIAHTFRRSSREEWINSAKLEYERLKTLYAHVIPVAFSMGGLISLYFNGLDDGVVFINMPVYYWNIPQILRNLRIDFTHHSKRYIDNTLNKSIHTLFEFNYLLKQSKPLICRIKCPALIFQAVDDDTVKPKSIQYISKQIPHAKVIMLPDGGHDVLLTDRVNEIAREICDFIEGLKL